MSNSTVPALTAQTFSEYQAALQSAVLAPTRAAHSLPEASDVGFFRSLKREFGQDLDAVSEKTLDLANSLLQLVKASESTGRGNSGRVLSDQDSVLDRYNSSVAEVVDRLLDRAVSVFLSLLLVYFFSKVLGGLCVGHLHR
jgi:beta-lactam-binding protein with PASTA domain